MLWECCKNNAAKMLKKQLTRKRISDTILSINKFAAGSKESFRFCVVEAVLSVFRQSKKMAFFIGIVQQMPHDPSFFPMAVSAGKTR